MAICSECKLECKSVWEDFGIGPYEFWGACATDVDFQWVSDCCGAETDEEPVYEEDERY